MVVGRVFVAVGMGALLLGSVGASSVSASPLRAVSGINTSAVACARGTKTCVAVGTSFATGLGAVVTVTNGVPGKPQAVTGSSGLAAS